MPSLQLTVPHEHGKEIAIERLQTFSETIKTQYGEHVKDLEEIWVEHILQFGFSAKGFKIKGNVKVEDQQVTVDGSLPLAAAIFRGRIESEVRTALVKVLA